MYSPSDYTSLYYEIKDISDNEKLDYIQNKLDTFWDNTENIEKTDIMPRYVLLSEFQKQLENITGYADYIESAAKSSGSNTFNIDKNLFALGMIFAVICLCSKNNVIVHALSVFISGMEVCAWA